MSIPRNLSIIADTLNSNGTFSSITNSALTSGRVVYSTTGGLETDSANLTFDGTNLSVGGSISSTIASKTAQFNAAGGSIYASFADGTKTWRFGAGIQSAGTVSLYNATDAVTAYTVDATGNVGIGTTSPLVKLHVATSGNTPIINETTGGVTSYFNLRNTGGQAYIASSTNDLLFALTAGATEGMRLTSTGLGIGTSSPIEKLTVNGNIATNASQSYVYSNGGSGSSVNSGFFLDGSGSTLRMLTGNSERARIDSSGNVGIGTTSPSSYGKLAVTNTTTSTNLALVNTSAVSNTNTVSTDYYLPDNSTGLSKVATIGVDNTSATGNRYGNIYFSTSFAGAPAERMRIDSSGNLLVGTTSQTATPNTGVQLTNFSGSIGLISIGHASGTATGNYYASFAYAGGLIGSITQSGTTAVLFNVTSDQRLKENIQDAESASSLIDALQVRQFDWKTDNTHQRYGFVAQELVTVAPEAVHQPVNEEEMMAVDYSKLVPMLVKEIQSLRKRLADAGIA